MSQHLLISRSRPLDVHHISKYPEVNNVVLFIFSELESGGYLRNVSKRKALKHLKVIVLDLYVVSTDPDFDYVGYSRAKGNYSEGNRLHSLFLSYRMMVRVVDALVELGYVIHYIGFYDKGKGTGFQSRMEASDKLLRLIDSHHVTREMITRSMSRIPDRPLIILRDKNGKNITYQETPDIREMREYLESFNRFLEGFSVGIEQSRTEIRKILVRKEKTWVNLDRTSMHRVFNGDFDHGGRFYGAWWQHIPRELRPFITIDGEQTSELDYSSQHLRMLYAEKGDEYHWLKGSDDDPYLLEGFPEEERKLQKQIVLVLVNASDRERAVKAIKKKITDRWWPFPKNHAFINSRIDALLHKHKEIRHHAFCGVGLRLQRLDSDICQYVLSHMQAKGIPVLTVHDSFIAPNGVLPHVYSVMKEVYRMKGISSIPDIKMIPGAGSDTSQTSFKALDVMMEEDRLERQKEVNAIRWMEEHYDQLVASLSLEESA